MSDIVAPKARSKKDMSIKKDKKDGSVKDKKDKKKEKKDKSKSQNNSMAVLPDVSVTNGAETAATMNGSPMPEKKQLQEQPANAKLEVCAGCGKNIMGDVSHAMNKKWHLYCFSCTVCSAPVSDEYYEADGKPYCRKDFNKLFGSSCAGCHKPLQGKKLKALEKEWHPPCFVCCKCKKPFPEMEYYDIDQQPYCGPCYDEEEEKLTRNK